jgi:hypothetical protein
VYKVKLIPPPLSADGKRKLRLQLEELDQKLGFAGKDHRRWPDSPDMREQAARSRIVVGEESYFDSSPASPS